MANSESEFKNTGVADHIAQGEKKRAIRNSIRNAALFDPDETWIFDLNEIPVDQNISDYCLGALELAQVIQWIPIKFLKRLYLVYKQAGRIREDRFVGGRPFLDPSGMTVQLGNKYLDGTDLSLPRGIYKINTLQDAPDFNMLQEKIFTGVAQTLLKKRKHPGDAKKQSLSSRLRKQAVAYESSSNTSDQGSETSGYSEQSEGDEEDREYQRRYRGKRFKASPPLLFKPRTKIQIPSREELTKDSEDWKAKFEVVQIETRNLKRKNKNLEAGYNDTSRMVQMLVQRTAKIGTSSISTTLQEAHTCTDKLGLYTVGLDAYYLAFFQKTFEKELMIIKAK
ncbi:hypothetical protein OIDMADRAFT_32465 [Oidiodendron maius Zn]|uniref:Uncharacterized protein n=1 Tax=Oidiodendron maius (strain Zn) TaxID=913774 RepID=A0A0C3GMZ1_OIDMZ|nr:hypothetical protein OIDMADRAFT_32465 [Oidiodendron maius Zn]